MTTYKGKGDLQNLFPDWSLDDRTTVWLCITLQGMGMRLNIDDFDTQRFWHQMTEWIIENDINTVIDDRRKSEIIPSHQLSWIEKNERQSRWLLKEFFKIHDNSQIIRDEDIRRREGIRRSENSISSKDIYGGRSHLRDSRHRKSLDEIQNRLNSRRAKTPHSKLNLRKISNTKRGRHLLQIGSLRFPEHLNEREYLIAWIDYLPVSKSRKLRTLEQLKTSWIQHQIEDQNFNWYVVGGKEREKCAISWEWYRKNKDNEVIIPMKFSKQEDVLLFLDHTDFSLDEKRYHLEQIKKAFKHEQTKANRRGKTQTNLSLSDEAKVHLEEIAKRERMTKTQLVEHLLLSAYLDGVPK